MRDSIDRAYTILIRKWDIVNGKHIAPNAKNIDKQIKTLHRKMKRCDSSIITYYTIEKDIDRNTYHTHLLIYTDAIKLVKEILKRYIAADEWIERNTGDRVFDELNSKFGLIHLEKLIDNIKYMRYISKYSEYNILT